MGKKRVKMPSTDRLLGVCAIVLSCCTLIVFFYQTKLIRKQQYMSVYPYLEIGHNNMHSKDYTFTLENKGVGPAIIESFLVGSEGAMKEQDFVEFLSDALDSNDKLMIEYSNLYVGKLVSEKEVVEIIKSDDTLKSTSKRLYQLLNYGNMDFEIIYSSIYGEKWKVTDKSSVPQKVD